MELTTNEKKEILRPATDEALAAQVVAYRVLGIDKDIAIFCMEQLAIRRNNGSQFNYEAYIEEKISGMPKPKSVDMKAVTGAINLKMVHDLIKKK